MPKVFVILNVLFLLFSIQSFAVETSKGIYNGIDSNGKQCQVQVLRFKEELDRDIPHSSDRYDYDLYYGYNKKSMTIITSLSPNDKIDLESPIIEGIGLYTTFSLSGTAGSSNEKDVQLRLEDGGGPLVDLSVSYTELFGYIQVSKTCKNLKLQSSAN